jgi:uncharacterized protein (DUF736 family)
VTYDNTNKGVLFQNYDKKTDKSPDYSGSLNVNGIDFNLAGWKKQSKKGTTFLSLSVSAKQDSPKSQAPDFDDSIPF